MTGTSSLLVLLVYIILSVQTTDVEQTQSIQESYSTYLETFQKDPRRGADTHRCALFKKNVEYIRQHNTIATATADSFSLRMNQFSDLTVDELAALHPTSSQTSLTKQRKLQGHPRADTGTSSSDVETKTLTVPARKLLAPSPPSINWAEAANNPTNQRVVSPVGNQALCGACWAFAAVFSATGGEFAFA